MSAEREEEAKWSDGSPRAKQVIHSFSVTPKSKTRPCSGSSEAEGLALGTPPRAVPQGPGIFHT